jgi:hypothetical protein
MDILHKFCVETIQLYRYQASDISLFDLTTEGEREIDETNFEDEEGSLYLLFALD